jgi:hypothetical protein
MSEVHNERRGKSKRRTKQLIMKIAIAADRAGFESKEHVKRVQPQVHQESVLPPGVRKQPHTTNNLF